MGKLVTPAVQARFANRLNSYIALCPRGRLHDVAKLAGCDRDTLRRWRNPESKSPPKRDYVQQAIQALGLDRAFIFQEEYPHRYQNLKGQLPSLLEQYAARVAVDPLIAPYLVEDLALLVLRRVTAAGFSGTLAIMRTAAGLSSPRVGMMGASQFHAGIELIAAPSAVLYDLYTDTPGAAEQRVWHGVFCENCLRAILLSFRATQKEVQRARSEYTPEMYRAASAQFANKSVHCPL